jgi:pantetheine-phosphate adenylyltransferase
MRIGGYSGTFDPLTNGHIDMIERSLKLFDKVIVIVAVNKDKKPLFSLEERVSMIQKSIIHLKNVEVVSTTDLLVRYASKNNIPFLIRGLRSVTDYLYEINMAEINQRLNKEIETIFIKADTDLSTISSSMVKELAKYGDPISKYVSPIVEKALLEKYNSLLN